MACGRGGSAGSGLSRTNLAPLLACWVVLRKSLSLSRPAYPSETKGAGLHRFLHPF